MFRGSIISISVAILQHQLVENIYIYIHMMETRKDYRDVTGSIDFKRDC